MIKLLVLTQSVCIVLMFSGAVIEFIFRADLGYMAITVGSLLFSVTTKLENYILTKGKGKL